MSGEADLGQRQQRRFRFRNGTMDFYAGWLLGYSQLGGLSAGEVFECLNAVRDGDPASWVEVFAAMARRQEDKAGNDPRPVPAAGRYLAAAVAARAAWHFVAPESDRARDLLAQLERCFQSSMACSGTPLTPVEVDTTAGRLPGYASAPIDQPSPTPAVWYVVIGGGDTFREDLYFFGGSRALAEGFHVLLLDLPGQGSTPYPGLHFGEGTVTALREVLVRLRRNWPLARIVVTGYSGGGYFTVKALADPATANAARVDALVASTPVTDIAGLLRDGMPAILTRRPDGRLARLLARLAGRISPVMDAALTKYNWQFGTDWIGEILPLAGAAGVVAPGELDVPLLAIVGESEPAESIRQAGDLFADVRIRRPGSRLVSFEKWTGADAHCQVNNLHLAQDTIIAWLGDLAIT